MDEETGDMKTKREITHVFFHFTLLDQFLGFSGSPGPFQVTRSGSFWASASKDGSTGRVGLAASRSPFSWGLSSSFDGLTLCSLILEMDQCISS